MCRRPFKLDRLTKFSMQRVLATVWRFLFYISSCRLVTLAACLTSMKNQWWGRYLRWARSKALCWRNSQSVDENDTVDVSVVIEQPFISRGNSSKLRAGSREKVGTNAAVVLRLVSRVHSCRCYPVERMIAFWRLQNLLWFYVLRKRERRGTKRTVKRVECWDFVYLQQGVPHVGNVSALACCQVCFLKSKNALSRAKIEKLLNKHSLA